MIINKNINPERDLYYLGGKVIEKLSSFDENEIDYFELFVSVNKSNKISLNLYSLVLDWLFILGVVKKGSNGLIVKCF
ncbi:ABC-three component system middle component 6 [Flavobacterium sp. '19STA2R22 D10 B1']|uniref:ABC-three component system middle component 6 n=1 Tax=Flavobacterium aerium TaxID=3037261 RepID=UPI00355799FB